VASDAALAFGRLPGDQVSEEMCVAEPLPNGAQLGDQATEVVSDLTERRCSRSGSEATIHSILGKLARSTQGKHGRSNPDRATIERVTCPLMVNREKCEGEVLGP
jgi:hypothetical protein